MFACKVFVFFECSNCTHWVQDIAITLIINENEPGSTRIWKNSANANHVAMFCDILPILDEEKVDATMLSKKEFEKKAVVSAFFLYV